MPTVKCRYFVERMRATLCFTLLFPLLATAQHCSDKQQLQDLSAQEARPFCPLV